MADVAEPTPPSAEAPQETAQGVIAPRIAEGGSGLNSQPELATPSTGRRNRRRSGLYRRGGRRDVKEYPLTFTELVGLGGLGLLAAFLGSLGSLCLSTWWQISQNFAFATPKDPLVNGYWQGLQTAAGVGAVLFYLGALAVLVCGGATILRIMRETEHED